MSAQPSTSVYWTLWSAINAYVEACGGDTSKSDGNIVAAMAGVYEAVDEFAASRVRSGRIDEQVWHQAFVAWYVVRKQPDPEHALSAARYADQMVECCRAAMELRKQPARFVDVGSTEKSGRGGGGAGTPDTGGMIGRGGGGGGAGGGGAGGVGSR